MTLELGFELQKNENLLQLFEVIHNYIYANDGLSPQQTLEEMTRLLFVKFFDENNKSNLFFVTSDELEAINSNNSAKSFTERINKLFQQAKNDFQDIFDSDEKIKLSANALSFSVEKLQNVSLTDSDNDVKGLAFQTFLANHEKGESGQFFTPTPVIDFCVDIIKPQPNEKIIDPACGSGGFLFSSLRYMQKEFPSLDNSKIIAQNLFGLEINKSVAKIAKMKLLLESNGKVNIFCTNSLSEKNKPKNNYFDVVLANPPFGTLGKITNAKTLSQYDLGFKWRGNGENFYKTNKILKGQVTEILFVEKCLSLLKEGGRMAIVLPNGHFENSSLEYLRNYIKQHAQITAVISLPQETFIPYGTGIKTSLLFLEKTSSDKNHKVFFSKVDKLGYQGNKKANPIYKKDNFGRPLKDEESNFIPDEDFSLVSSDYTDFKSNNLKKSNRSFKISSQELNGRLNYVFYHPKNRNLIQKLREKKAVRLCEIAKIVKGKSKKLKNSDSILEYIELSDINTQTSEIINSTSYAVHELPSRASYELRIDDIITAAAGNSVGTRKHATALVGKENFGAICTNGFRVLRNFEVDPYYLLFYLRSKLFLQQVFMYRTGATIPSISDTDFSNLLVYIPNDEEVKEISEQMRMAFKLRDMSKKSLHNVNSKLIEYGF
jgi:type I restriction enzyme M protein